MHLQSVTNGLPLITSAMAMEEGANAAPRFPIGESPPSVAPSLEGRVSVPKRPLEPSETPEDQAAKRALADKTDPCLAVQNLLARAEDYTRRDQYGAAIDALVGAMKAAKDVSDNFGQANFLEKLDRGWVESLLKRTNNDQRIAHLLLQKDWIRMAFEKALHVLSARSPQKEPPTCFICFAIEADTKQWLENTFVPDLDRAGIAPLFCYRQFGPGKDLNRFQYLIRLADSAVIICTPELKQRCKDRENNPTGCAMEVYFATGREGIYPVCLKGSFPDLSPNPSISPRLATTFTILGNSTASDLYSYYAGAFELFGAIRGIEREEARNAANAFLSKVQMILQDKTLDEKIVQKWHQEAPNRSQAIRAVAAPVIDAALKQLLVVKDRLHLIPAYPHFAGRTAQLKQLSSDFQIEAWKPLNATVVRVLHGPGGIGKTELAIRFGNEHLHSFSLIWFLRAETPKLFEEDYRDLAKALSVDIDEKDSFEDVQRKVHMALEKEAAQTLRPWLLILDNVVTRINPIEQRGGYVIATSQTRDVWSYNNFMEVPPFSTQDTEALFQQMKVSLNEGDAQLLVEQMEGFPVLLEKVGQCFKRTLSYTLAQYLREVKNDDLIQLSRDGERYPKMLKSVFKATLARLADKNRAAFAFIQFCAYLNPDRISTCLLDFWIKNRRLTPQDRIEIEGSLHDFSLLRFDLLSQTFSCHRLLQFVVQQDDETGEVFRSCFDTLAKWAAQSAQDLKEDMKKRVECFHHVEKLRKVSWWKKLEEKERIKLLFKSGCRFLESHWDDGKGDAQLVEAFELSKAVFGEGSPEVAKIKSELELFQCIRVRPIHRGLLRWAMDCYLSERYEEALTRLETAWDFVKDGHQDRGGISLTMGATLEKLSRDHEALPFYVTAFQDAVLAKHSAQDKCFCSLYQSLEKQIDTQEAVKTTEELIAFCMQHCGEASDYVIQLRKLASARTSTCWLM